MKHPPEELEKLVHRTLRSLPDRRAPASLEMRVMSGQAGGAPAHPAQWPAGIRLAAIVVSLAAAAAFVAAPFLLAGTMPALLVLELEAAARDVFQAIPAPWLYAGTAAVAFGSALLLGAGAIAYRLFSISPFKTSSTLSSS